mmetsp:Transcript_25798/g.43503  ORF Transcript_25798/g.43503 Transcript_25798/m.43503 type:complete len:374 (-) Transcript_25798:516-1637(-)|eukprot:CAMPEP_0114426906 /NCGR_PEP_ID=MMETSP0103-20121206/8056_1 /TAXON_ID=37642 ORGANISM="Paraphysomonas imperforata, Strain PA2" /NCGR_SAMPLE_ID=MMETSP0103 /ASSEMBLY_ACC=CAM_ASM_000201 /LENGTH=373 /DNA_ID=CAMNT_0001595915 /DNA_START=64 /DNA_END=1185 /DNA_ORIENTATION=-
MSPKVNPASGGALPPIKTSPSKPSTDENATTKQIHTYHKLFWRINCTLEFNIFFHSDRKLYEIAAYNSEKDQEFEALFLAEQPVKDQLFGADNLKTEIEKTKVKMSKDRFKQMPTPEKLVELAHISIFNKFVESHLNPKADGTLILANLPGETFDIDSMISEQEEEPVTEVLPEANGAEEKKVEVENNAAEVVPKKTISNKTRVVRQRSSIVEFNKSLSLLKQDSQSLKAANKMTENLLNLSKMSVNAFKDALQYNAGTSKRYDKSTPLGRFRWAVHRVILQQYVEAVRLRIETFEKKKKAIRINGTFPIPGSADMNSPQAKVLALRGRLNASPQMQNLSEVLSRDNTPKGSPRGKPGKKGDIVKHSVSLPVL